MSLFKRHLAPGPDDRTGAAGNRRSPCRSICPHVVLGLIAVASLLMASGCGSHAGGQPATGEKGRRTVNVTRPERVDSATLTLPANIDAFQTTLLYSRVSGYLQCWNADIGDRVQKGQPLAEIDTPEADQELNQARANLVQGRADLDTSKAQLQEAEAALKQAEAEVARMKANLEFAHSVMQRNEKLIDQHALSIQDMEESRRDHDVSKAALDAADAQVTTRQSNVTTSQAKIKSHEATVNSLEANVRRLEELQAFKTIRAPFDGIVTRRRAEIGILVTAGTSAASQELFAIAQADRLRIRINVPQAHALTVQAGQEAQVLVPEYPNRPFTARVARTARSIDASSRTLMVELELPNPDNAILPGTFAQVVLTARKVEAGWIVPAGVLLARSDGLRVAVVESGDTVRLCKVVLGRDYGTNIEVLSGLKGNERLVINPPDTMIDREPVIVADKDPPKTKGPPVAVSDGHKTRS